MKVIIVRHDDRRSGEKERKEQRNKFTQFMASLQLQNVVVFSSRSDDATPTSDALGCLWSVRKIELSELSDSPSPSDLVESILDEAEAKLQRKPPVDTWVLIGHHPRLSQFLARVTGTRQRPLGHLHAVCVSAIDPTQLRLGRGQIEWRYPILDVEGDKLGPKLKSKMVVGALLAGFDFTALLELVKDPANTPVIKGTSLGLTTQALDYVTF